MDGLPELAALRPTALPALLLLPLLPVFLLLPAHRTRWFFIVSGLALVVALAGPVLMLGLLAAALASYALVESWVVCGAHVQRRFVVGLLLLHAAYFGCFLLPVPPAFTNLRPADQAGVFILFSGIGLTFFRAVSYLHDRARRGQPALTLTDYLAYMLYFPQLRHGPLERAAAFAPQLRAARARWTWRDGAWGLARLAWVVVFLRCVDELVRQLRRAPEWTGWPGVVTLLDAPAGLDRFFADPAALPVGQFLLLLHLPGLALYALESIFAHVQLASGRCFGVRGTENYRYPLMATSPRMVWQRWNITLGTWLRDYAFTPLGGARRGLYRNTVLTFVYCGLLHAPQGRALVWGLFVGLSIALNMWIEQRLRLRSRQRHSAPGVSRTLRRFLFRVATFHWGCLGVMILLDPAYCGLRVLARYVWLLVDVATLGLVLE